VTAAIGVVCGLGEYLIAAVAAALVLALLTIGAAVDHRFFGRLEKNHKPHE
jgi:uncharacterized membrane protein YhiD involved in acid resistance